MTGLYHRQVQDMCASQAPVPLSDMRPFPFLVADVERNGCKCETSRLEPLSSRCVDIFNEFTCKNVFINAKPFNESLSTALRELLSLKQPCSPKKPRCCVTFAPVMGTVALCAIRGMPDCLAHLLRLAT